MERLAENITEIEYTYLPREDNQFADALAKMASMRNIPQGMSEMPLIIETRCDAAYVMALEEEENEEPEPWFTDIRDGEYPPNLSAKDRRAPRLQAANFWLHDTQL